MILVCHVITQNHVIIWSCEFIDRSRSSHHPVKFCDNRHFGSGNIVVLVRRMISQDHVIQDSCDFMGWTPYEVPPVPSLVVIGIVVVEICFLF